jgi:hypothetical protein
MDGVSSYVKNQLPWIPLIVAALLLAKAVYIAITGGVPIWLSAYQSKPHDLIGTLVSLAGWLLALAGLLQAGKEAKRGLTFTALLKLHDEEGADEQAEAKKLVWQAAPPGDYSGNPYSFVRKYVRNLPSERREKLNWARRRLTSFWYNAARLVELGTLTVDDIFKSVGPPDIVVILEPLEAIQAESINPAWQPRDWPPMRLFTSWLKKQKDSDMWGLQLPARPELYKASRIEILK